MKAKTAATIIGWLMVFCAIAESVILVIALVKMEELGTSEDAGKGDALKLVVFTVGAVHGILMALLGTSTVAAGQKRISCLYWPFLVMNGIYIITYLCLTLIGLTAIFLMAFSTDHELNTAAYTFVGSSSESMVNRKYVATLISIAFGVALLLFLVHKAAQAVVSKARKEVRDETDVLNHWYFHGDGGSGHS